MYDFATWILKCIAPNLKKKKKKKKKQKKQNEKKGKKKKAKQTAKSLSLVNSGEMTL